MVSALKVIAPATLKEGHMFEAKTVEGRIYQVTVPMGGVNAGDEFTVYNHIEITPEEDTSDKSQNSWCSCIEGILKSPLRLLYYEPDLDPAIPSVVTTKNTGPPPLKSISPSSSRSSSPSPHETELYTIKEIPTEEGFEDVII